MCFRGLRMCGGGGGGGRFGGGFSRKLAARVETQAHLAFRCDPEWGMHKRLANLFFHSERLLSPSYVSLQNCLSRFGSFGVVVSTRCSSVLGVDVELLFVACGCVVVVGEFSVASCESVLCVSGLSVFVHVELFFVACGCVVVVGELAVASCGSVLCVSGLSVFVHVELYFVACGCVVVVGEFGSGFSWKLTARVETQAHLALRCDSE